MAENTNTERELYNACHAYINAHARMETAMADGYNVHGAISGLIGAEDNLRASLSLPAAGQEPVATAMALAQLRHLYHNMIGGGVRDAGEAKTIAAGVLAPVIVALETSAAPQPAVAAGWMMVPVVPSEQMKLAAKAADMDHSDYRDWIVSEWPEFLRIWTAMLKAAPLPPAPSTEGESNG